MADETVRLQVDAFPAALRQRLKATAAMADITMGDAVAEAVQAWCDARPLPEPGPRLHQALGRCWCQQAHGIDEAMGINRPLLEAAGFMQAENAERGRANGTATE